MAKKIALFEPIEVDAELKKRALLVYERLLELHGEIELVPRREPLHELISTMLSHRTTERSEALAYTQMWEKFGSWEAIRDAPTDELAAAIAPANYPGAKAANIQKTLAHIIDKRGSAEIEFLRDLPAEAALQWLVDLPGVGVKTATLVLLFCFHKAVIPVDTHLHRICGRLGLMGPKVSAEAAHAILLQLLPCDAYVLYNFHIAMLRHGQRICIWKNPRCAQCNLCDVCDWYQENKI